MGRRTAGGLQEDTPTATVQEQLQKEATSGGPGRSPTTAPVGEDADGGGAGGGGGGGGTSLIYRGLRLAATGSSQNVRTISGTLSRERRGRKKKCANAFDGAAPSACIGG